jgi:hypothetical protein
VSIMHVCQDIYTDVRLSACLSPILFSFIKQPVSFCINCTTKLGNKSVRINI